MQTSLIADYPTYPGRDPQEDIGRVGSAGPRAAVAAAPTASYIRPLPEWLPYSDRLVLLPKGGAAAEGAGGFPRERRDVGGGLRPAVFGPVDKLVTAVVASLESFTVGALVPFLLGVPVLLASLVLAGLCAFGGGAAVARLTGRPGVLGGVRQFTAAFVAADVAFVIGHLIGGHG